MRGHLPYIQRVPVPMLPLDLLIISRLALAFLVDHCSHSGLFCMIKLKAYEISRFQSTLIVHIFHV